jgi:mRNA interferase RelE/StbE
LTFELVFARQAQRQLEKLNPQTALRIVEGCERLKRNPFPDGKHVKKLKGYEELYRLRVGDFRVVFQRSGSRIDVIDVLSKPDFQKAY